MVGDEADAVGLDDAVVAVAHVPDAVPAIPAPSNSGVGAEVPDIAPVAEDSPGSEPAVPLVEFPMPEAAVCIAPMVLEHAEGVVIVIALEAEEPDVIGLTPGVASSVAPSGKPVPPTGAPAPIPSGEVIPSGGVTAPMPTCANAAPTLHNDQTVAAAKIPFAVFCALQLFIPDLSYSRGFLPRKWHEIDRSGSGPRRRSPHRHCSDRIRVRADRMNTLDEPFSGLLVDASDGHGKRYQLLSARMPLTIVAHVLPGRRVIVRPTLGAIGSISARYHGADDCSITAEPAAADVHRTATAKPHGEGRGCNC
jgi:hypothetical protein